MRTPGFLFLLSIFSLLSCGTGSKQKAAVSDTAFYSVKIPDKMNMKNEKPRIITLTKDKRFHFISFGKFSTPTTVSISTIANPNDSANYALGTALLINFPPETETLIDITKKNPATYMINFTADAEGCSFKLTIQK